MKDNMHNRILTGETTERDARMFRWIQLGLVILSIILVITVFK